MKILITGGAAADECHGVCTPVVVPEKVGGHEAGGIVSPCLIRTQQHTLGARCAERKRPRAGDHVDTACANLQTIDAAGSRYSHGAIATADGDAVDSRSSYGVDVGRKDGIAAVGRQVEVRDVGGQAAGRGGSANPVATSRPRIVVGAVPSDGCRAGITADRDGGERQTHRDAGPPRPATRRCREHFLSHSLHNSDPSWGTVMTGPQ